MKYIIKLDGKYYAGEGPPSHRKSGGGGWYIFPTESSQIALADDKKNAHVMDAMINVNSHWQRIYEAIRWREIERPKRIEIIEVE